MGFPVHIKAGMSRVSIAKEIAEVSRLRLQFERNLGFQMYSIFAKVAEDAAREYRASGDVYKSLIGIDGRIEAAIRAHQSAVIERFAARAFDNRKADRFTSLVFQYYNDDQAQKVTNISSVTRLNIANAIRAGERDAMGVDKTAKLIVERTAGAIGRARAATIARTETHAAASYATHEATREMDLPAPRKRWVAVGDARTRGHHAAANGQEVGMDEKFIIRYKGQEIEMMHPHDGSGGAGNNINCRCLALYYSNEDAIFDDEPLAPVEPAPVALTPPETPTQPDDRSQATDDPLGPDARFVSPRDKALTVATLPKRKKSEVIRELEASVKAASLDPKNADVWDNSGRWRGQTEKDFGRAGITSFGLKSATAVNAVNNELNYLADFIGVPRLRGIKAARSKRINGSMGGGIMDLSNKSVGIYIEEANIRPIDKIKVDLEASKTEYYAARNALRDVAREGVGISDP